MNLKNKMIILGILGMLLGTLLLAWGASTTGNILFGPASIKHPLREDFTAGGKPTPPSGWTTTGATWEFSAVEEAFRKGAVCGMLASQPLIPDKFSRAYLFPPEAVFWARVKCRCLDLDESESEFHWETTDTDNPSCTVNYYSPKKTNHIQK